MTLLRSREIVPKLVSKTPAKSLDIGIFEPETPAEIVEGLNNQSITTTPLSTIPKAPSGSDMGLGSGTERRRSLRLASKLDSESKEDVGIVNPSRRKRKRSDAKNEGNLGNELNLGTPPSEKKSDLGTGDVQLGVRSVGVSQQVEIKIGDLGKVSEVLVDAVLVEKIDSGLPADPGFLGRSNDGVESVRKGNRKRKFGLNTEFSTLEVQQNQDEKKVFNLRSGRRIVERGGKHMSGDSSEGIKSNEGDKLCCGSETGLMSTGCRGNADMMNYFGVKSETTEIDSISKDKKLVQVDKGKGKELEKASSTNGVNLLKSKLEVKEAGGNITGTGMHVKTRSQQRKEKGKEKLVDSGLSSKFLDSIACKSANKLEKGNENIASGSTSLAASTSSQNAEQINMSVTAERRVYKERFRDIARRNASRFAHFPSEEEDDHVGNAPGREISPSDISREPEDWPGPFSTAMKIIKDRQMNARMQQQNSSLDKSRAASILWTPKMDGQHNLQKQLAPSLQDLCLKILVKNADAITSLDCVPDVLRHKLSHLLCDSRRMSSYFLGLLTHGSPTEIRLPDCSWLSEEIFTRTFEECDISNLVVLQLDQCGRCVADYVLFGTLTGAPNCLPALTTLSLRAAYRLSDIGLNALVSAAPSLRSINLSQCSLLTSDGICGLAAVGSVLRELYLDDCQGIDAMLILPALLKFKHLEVLSLAGIETVCDDFVSEFVREQGYRMKELVLADCMRLTDSSIRVIAEYCADLCTLNLSNLSKLTDTAIGYLANGCRAIQTFKLCRNSFSDEAFAAYLETCGDSLRELSLSNVKEVAQNTAISLARHSANLHYLDLSWCRNLTNEALGLVVDSCSSLKVLKVFGCTQITDVFLLGHSNPGVQIIGLKMKPILENVKLPDLLQGPLHYSSICSTL